MSMKNNPIFRHVILLALIVVVPCMILSGCTRQVSWISVDPKSVELNKEGETVQLRAVALDKNNQPIPDTVLTWVSSNPNVAPVDDKGVVTAKGTGQSTITVSSANGEKALVQCKVAILKSIKVEPATLSLKPGEKAEMSAIVLNEKDEPSEVQNVAWATSDESIVFIDDLGTITAVAPGEVTITATTPTKDLSHVYGTAKVTVGSADAATGEAGAEAAPAAEAQ